MTEHEATIEKEHTPEVCARRGCLEPGAKRLANGTTVYCIKHHKIARMRDSASRRGKHVPTVEELEQLIARSGMVCRDCGCQMVWSKCISTTQVMTLQHYRDGVLAVVCLSCNSKHGRLPGGIYRDAKRETKWCHGCHSILPLSMFGSRKSYGKRVFEGRCQECKKIYRRASSKRYRKRIKMKRHARIEEVKS